MFTDPVVGKDFFGREGVLQLLLKRASALHHGYRQNIAILGPELIGKSSLLQHFMMRFENSETVPIYIEVRTHEPYEAFADRYLTIFLHAFLKIVQKGEPSEDEKGTPIQSLKRSAPKTASWLTPFMDKRSKMDPTESFFMLLELPSRLWKETGKFFILILDEFDRLLNFGIQEPFAHLGKQIMIQKETMYLLASSQVGLARLILRQRLSLLFGHFETITLGPFPPLHALEYLEKRWRLEGLEGEVKQFLVTLTGGHPFYLNVLGQHLSPFSASDLRHSSKAIVSVLEKVLFNAQGILNQYFTMRLNRAVVSDTFGTGLALLRSLCRHSLTSQEIRHLFKRKETRQKLKGLFEAGILSKSGDCFKISDRLFSFWLRSCYEKKSNVLAGNIFEQSAEFRKEAELTLRDFLDQFKRDPREKILGLFRSFRGEMIEIDQKAHRLPHFSDVQLRNGKKGDALIIGYKEKGSWVSSFFEHEVAEEDVAEFLGHCATLEGPVYQKILISPSGITENARLIAKKERVWTWGLEDVSMLLEMYGQGPTVTLEGTPHE